MLNRTRFIAPIILLAGVLTSWAVAGCSSPAATFCNAKCDCEGNCSQTNLDTCVKTNDDNDKLAHDAGCGAQADAWSSCVNDRSECIGGKYTTGGCDTEFSTLLSCLTNNKCIFIGANLHCA